KERTFEVLLRHLEALTRRQPVLFFYEDLHWIDPSSRELLDRTIERAASLPMLLIATHRPEFVPPWSGLPQVTTVTLRRLEGWQRRSSSAPMARTAARLCANALQPSPHLPVRPDWLDRRREEIIEPDLPIVDPHHHLVERPETGRYLLPEL